MPTKSRPKLRPRPKARPRPKVRRTKAEQRATAIAQILDRAEELFSMHGFSGATIKDVAEKAGVHSALILYYFGDKKGLFDTVWARRLENVVAARTKSLEDYEAQAGGHPTAEGVLKAYYGGAFDAYIEGGEGVRNFGRIFAQINNMPGYGTEKMQLYFDPPVLRLIEILQKALPDVDRKDIFWGFQFTSGAYSQALARTGRIDRLSDGLCSSDDLDSIRDRMSVFMAAGFEALANRKGVKAPPRDQNKGRRHPRVKGRKADKTTAG